MPTDDLTPAQLAGLEFGLAQLDDGAGIPHDVAMREILAELTALGQEIGELPAYHCAEHDTYLPCRKCDRRRSGP